MADVTRVLPVLVMSAVDRMLPPRGWSTWNTFKCDINASLIEESINAMASSKLQGAGYNYVLIDDCWTTCMKPRNGDSSHGCDEPGPRDPVTHKIQVDKTRFPTGFEPLTAKAHAAGLKIGIYTSVSAVTCGGFTGSLGFEDTDAAAFIDWGFDFIKHDTCGTDCPIHNGCIQNATARMAKAIYEHGRGETVYYLDSGNPTSPQRVYNPYNRGVHDDEALLKVAVRPSELVWNWATRLPHGPHLFKSWFDRSDTWPSFLTNVHNQVRIAEFQSCGRFNMPDMLTLGQGGQTEGQYRAQFFLYAVLGAPLIMGCDVRAMSNFTENLATAPEVLAVQADPDCVQGSLARAEASTEVWIKPLRSGAFACVLMNKSPNDTAEISVQFNGNWHDGQDLYPAKFFSLRVRDLFKRRDLGVHIMRYTAAVPPMDAVIVSLSPSDVVQPLAF